MSKLSPNQKLEIIRLYQEDASRTVQWIAAKMKLPRDDVRAVLAVVEPRT